MGILHLIYRPLRVVVIALTMTSVAHAAGEVDSVSLIEKPATPFRYEINGVTYTWGMGNNQLLEGFTVGGFGHSYSTSADRVELRRDDIAGVSKGNPCGVFAERLGAKSEVLKTDYPSDGSGTGNCDMAAMLASRVINRGALDIFSNKVPNPKNVERVDYLFDTGVSAPFDSNALSQAGHLVAEKRGNNSIKIAAILQLDIFGQPQAYGPLVKVYPFGCAASKICYGVTSLRHNYTFFQSNSLTPQGYPRYLTDSTESVAMAFVSASDLGLYEGQRYYGFSYFPKDVDSSQHNLLDPASFPDDTADDYILPGDGADIYGGVSGYFVRDDMNNGNGRVFKDENEDGIDDINEAGIASISLTLYQDSDNNGVFDKGVDQQLGDSLESDISGKFTLPGLTDGSYYLLLDESDADIPPGLIVPAGSNPAIFQVAGADVPSINFGFITDNQGGDTSGGDTSGGDTSGGDTSGGDTSGGDTSGGDTSGGDTSGGDTSGGDTSGGDTSGGDTSGGDTSGGDTSGGDTSGGDTSGGDTSGATTGGPIDDPATMAILDTATVNQGDSVSIDVLANDIDGAGAGLTLVSVSESPNANISIVNGQVNYTPNFGFYGPDTFLYVMQDGDGTQASGTVNVQVDRYSDINDNGINDFVECNCTNLTLETGVHGTGLGKFRIEFLLLIGLIGLMRTRGKWMAGAHS